MKLKQLHIYNFRCFKELSIKFDDKLTVIVAENGAGKTAILDAIALGFGRYLTKLPGVAGRATKTTDLRVDKLEKQAPFMMLGWQADTPSGMISWSSGRKRDASISIAEIEGLMKEEYQFLLKQGAKGLDGFALDIVKREAAGEPVFLPMVAYYGTNRAIREEVQRRRGFKQKFSRFDALIGALEPDSSFRSAFEWFNAMEDVERREQQTKRDFDYRLPELQWVRAAIEQMLNGDLVEPRTLVRPLRFVIDKVNDDGSRQTLRISQLSDGYKIVLGLVMDLARRMVEANPTPQPQLDIASPLALPAIVLIDEIDLHLHPKWQQQVLGDLTRIFPNTQFIVTTHSPQVISTVHTDSIRVLGLDTNGNPVAATPLAHTYGEPSNSVLRTVMQVDPQPPIDERALLLRLTELVDQGQGDEGEAKGLMAQLLIVLGAEHPQLQRLQRSIARQQWLKGLDAKQ
ncbi:AAA family ATPase [Aeromonas sp. QDB17]|uniref:AAA family ATPase n=1 Tax=Aeromonas sp. QDB17 TaxID=2990485 RepID=UPI0022E02239|nr:AAA family ATPase [Aeromonas sp. QDB17]